MGVGAGRWDYEWVKWTDWRGVRGGGRGKAMGRAVVVTGTRCSLPEVIL